MTFIPKCIKIHKYENSQKQGSEPWIRGSFCEKWAFLGVIFKKILGPPQFFFDVLSGWGGQVHPQKYQKIVGEASFPFLGPGKNLSLEAKFLYFCPWGACGNPGHGPKFSKVCF